jgi:predicted ATPase
VIRDATSNYIPAASPNRLYLVAIGGSPEFRPVFDALAGMGFYNLNPDVIRAPQTPSAEPLLVRDGSNLRTILRQVQESGEGVREKLEEYLSRIAPGVSGVDVVELGSAALYETLEFRQETGTKIPWRFTAGSMPDGTLRALAILVALFQSGDGSRPPARLVGIEKPKAALHPAASR